MALLDRFRTHPGHKNPDPAARLQFVQELPLDERDLLLEVAREDADPRVHDRAHTHQTRLDRDVERGAGQTIVAQPRRGVAHRDDLGVRRGVMS